MCSPRVIGQLRTGSLAIALLSIMSGLVGCATKGGSEPAGAAFEQAGPTSQPTTQPGAMATYSMAYPTGNPSSSNILLERTQPQEMRVNQPYEYQLKVTNLTDQPLNNVVIHEQWPQSFHVSGVSGAEAPGGAGGNQYAIGELGPRQSKTLTITGTPSQPGTVGSCTSITYSPSLCAASSVINPMLKVSLSGPAQADICQPIAFTYEISNTGVGTERNVHIENHLPDGLLTQDGKDVVWLNVGDLSTGESKQMTVQLKASHPGQFSSVATAASDYNNVQSQPMTTTVQAPNLAVQIKGPQSEYLNKPVTYEVTLSNTGDAPAQQVAMNLGGVDKSQIASISPVGGEGEARLAAAQEGPGGTLGTLSPGQSQTYQVTIKPAQPGTVNLTVNAKAPCAQEASASAQTDIRTLSALTLEAVDLKDPVPVGDNVVYRITVTNQGNGPDTNIRVNAILPDAESYVNASGATAAAAQGQQIVFAPVQALDAGQTVTWQVEAKALKPADARFKVELRSDNITGEPAVKIEPTRLY